LKTSLLSILIPILFVTAAYSGEADVVKVRSNRSSNGSYHFDVSVAHSDTGWEHYADKWDIVAPDGSILGTRTLLHPHVNEQPFTRSLSGVKIPAELSEVSVRAHDSVHKYGGKEVTVNLTN